MFFVYGYKKGEATYLFSPFFFVGSGIRDVKKSGSGINIQDPHDIELILICLLITKNIKWY